MGKIYKVKLLFFLLLFFGAFACNNPISYQEEVDIKSPSISQVKKKVLLISIEGAKGSVLKSAEIPNISNLLSNSIYSWDAVTGEFTSDQAGWASLFTGVDGDKNGVEGAKYKENQFTNFPTFMERMLKTKPNLQIVSVTNSLSLNDTLLNDNSVTESIRVESDAEVSDVVSEKLQSEDLDILLATLGETNQVGKEFGFSEFSDEYVNAIEQADQYIGQILEALEERKKTNEEDWMVVISSNHGGSITGEFEEGSLDDRNAFVLFYSQGFTKNQIDRPLVNVPYSGTFPLFYRSGGVDHSAYSEDPIFHFGEDMSFTIEFNFKAELPWVSWYNPIITNKDWASGSNTGWLIFFQDGKICYNFMGENGPQHNNYAGPDVGDGLWHHITVVFDREGPVSIYDDGEFFTNAGGSLLNNGNVNSGYPFAIGTQGPLNYNLYGDAATLNSYISEVRVWKEVLSPEEIKNWSFIPITEEHPSYSSLIGYWRLIGGANSDQVARDYSPTGANLTIQNGLKWEQLDEVLNVSDVDATLFVPHTTDLARNILAWMGIKILPEWELEGEMWIIQ